MAKKHQSENLDDMDIEEEEDVEKTEDEE